MPLSVRLSRNHFQEQGERGGRIVLEYKKCIMSGKNIFSDGASSIILRNVTMKCVTAGSVLKLSVLYMFVYYVILSVSCHMV